MNPVITIIIILGLIGGAAAAGIYLNNDTYFDTESNQSYRVLDRTGTWEERVYDDGHMERVFAQAYIEDQNEKGTYHRFLEVVNMSMENGQLRFDITNYYVNPDKSEETYYMVLKPYVILNDSDVKLDFETMMKKYPTVKTKFHITPLNNHYDFYPSFTGIPVYSTSYEVKGEEHNSWHSPFVYLGYDLISTNMNFKLADDNWNFRDVDLRLSTADLRDNDYEIEVTNNEIKINVIDKVNENGELKADPSVELDSIYGVDIQFNTNTYVYTRIESFGKVGCGPTPTPPPPP